MRAISVMAALPLLAARLLERADELEPFARFHFAGVWDEDGTAMTRAIAEAVGRPNTAVKPLSWRLVWLAGLIRETPRESIRCAISGRRRSASTTRGW